MKTWTREQSPTSYQRAITSHVHLFKYVKKQKLESPAAYAEMCQVIGLDKILFCSNMVEICGIILEIVQNGHNCTFFVVRKQRLKTYVLKSDGAVQTLAPYGQVLNGQL